MTPEMWLTLAILAIAIILFITEWLRVDVVALGVVVALMVTGLITTNEALSGFSNPVVLTVASLFIVGGGVLHTGLAALIGERILRVAGHDERRLILVIMLAVALLSGFMSDTGTVAVLLPAIISLARSANISPSKLLIPLSYGALLGGASTLIGTPPNIIVSDLLRDEATVETFSFFSYTPIGVMMILAGTAFMVTLGRRILPDYRHKTDLREQVQSPIELIDLYRLPDNLFRLRVPEGSSLVGQNVGNARLRSDFGVTVLDVQRPDQPQPLVRIGDQHLVLQSEGTTSIRPTPETTLQPNDVLIVQGDEKAVREAVAFWDVVLQPASATDHQSLVNQEGGLAEVLLPPRSSLIGRTLVESRFGSIYKLTVLSISRPGANEPLDLKTTPLQFGDTLLVQGFWQNIVALRKNTRDFVVMGQPESMIGAPARAKAPLALLILLGMLVLLVAGAGSVAMISMAAGLAMVLAGCLSMDEAYDAIDWKSVVLIAGMLPMSLALEQVGLVSLIAEGLTDGLGEFGPLAIMAGLFLITSLFTQVISNTATTVLVAPIALATARELNVHPHAFMMAIAIAASMAFASPVASPVNTLVMGAGSYRFSDYIKIGVPMIAIMLLVVLVAVPILFPF